MRAAIKHKDGGDVHQAQTTLGAERTEHGGGVGVHGIR